MLIRRPRTQLEPDKRVGVDEAKPRGTRRRPPRSTSVAPPLSLRTGSCEPQSAAIALRSPYELDPTRRVHEKAPTRHRPPRLQMNSSPPSSPPAKRRKKQPKSVRASQYLHGSGEHWLSPSSCSAASSASPPRSSASSSATSTYSLSATSRSVVHCILSSLSDCTTWSSSAPSARSPRSRRPSSGTPSESDSSAPSSCARTP